MVPVSTRTMKFTVRPVAVVVFARSAGRPPVAGNGLNGCWASAGVLVGRYTCCTTVLAEQFASSGGLSVDPSGRVNPSVWQTNGCCHVPEITGPVIG
jgi:hypothetical protein